jgi:hypothetical protein
MLTDTASGALLENLEHPYRPVAGLTWADHRLCGEHAGQLIGRVADHHVIHQ